MIRDEMIKEIEKLINGEILDLHIDEDKTNSAVDLFMLNTALRLSKTYLGFCSGNKGISDLFSSLRNFMLVFQTSLRIDSLQIEKDNEFGIYRDSVMIGTVSGATVKDMAGIAKQLKLHNAMCLDGGASSGLYFEKGYITAPGRNINNALCFTVQKDNKVSKATTK